MHQYYIDRGKQKWRVNKDLRYKILKRDEIIEFFQPDMIRYLLKRQSIMKVFSDNENARNQALKILEEEYSDK